VFVLYLMVSMTRRLEATSTLTAEGNDVSTDPEASR